MVEYKQLMKNPKMTSKPCQYGIKSCMLRIMPKNRGIYKWLNINQL